MMIVALSHDPIPYDKKRGYATRPGAWALTPDVDDPTSWRLPLYFDGSEVPDPGLVAYALGRLSPDAHPTIPVRQAREARERIREAWRVLHPEGDLPKVLQKQQDVTFDPTEVEGEMSGGVMIAFGLAPDVAGALVVKGDGVPDAVEAEPVESLHMTVKYLGPLTSWPSDALETLAAVLRTFAPYEWPLSGEVNGFGVFDVGQDATGMEQGAAVALVDVPGWTEWHARLCSMLDDYGMGVPENHGSTPHITLAYGPVDDLHALPQPPVVGVLFDSLMLVAGQDVWRFPFDGQRLATTYDAAGAMPVIVAAAEQRYTMTPLYVPDVLDAHDEWASGDDLQQMVWDYVRNGNRTVQLQHVPGTIAGETVEIMCWPFELRAPMLQPDGTTKEVTLPAGTVYQGVVWEPWAFAEVKSGNIGGLSMGGAAYRTDQTPGEE